LLHEGNILGQYVTLQKGKILCHICLAAQIV